uniref:Uncharacterized protein n=1 Tax=Glossina pallidipes TaxID=7398 RepID=A0A1A9ZGK4_GLOPL
MICLLIFSTNTCLHSDTYSHVYPAKRFRSVRVVYKLRRNFSLNAVASIISGEVQLNLAKILRKSCEKSDFVILFGLFAATAAAPGHLFGGGFGGGIGYGGGYGGGIGYAAPAISYAAPAIAAAPAVSVAAAPAVSYAAPAIAAAPAVSVAAAPAVSVAAAPVAVAAPAVKAVAAAPAAVAVKAIQVPPMTTYTYYKTVRLLNFLETIVVLLSKQFVFFFF